MDRSFWINRIINLYFNGYKVEQAIKITKKERKEQELIKINGKSVEN